MSPRTTPKRSSSYRHSLMTFSWMGASKACPIGCSAQLLRPEDVLEQPLPFLLLVPAEDSGNDFSVLQPLAHIGGIDRYVVAGRGSAARGEETVRPAGRGESCAPPRGPSVGGAPSGARPAEDQTPPRPRPPKRRRAPH